MQLLKQSTSATVNIGGFIDDTDGKTPETALTIAYTSVYLSKNGGSFSAKSDTSSATHSIHGQYLCPLGTTDTGTLGLLRISVVISGALPVWEDFLVVPANVYDSLVGGSANLAVDSVAISGDSAAADNLEAFTDGTGYAGGTIKLNVNASSITTDAITADAFKTDAITEIVSGLTGATLSELSQGQPPATPTVAQAIMLLYMALRNAGTLTASTGVQTITNNAGTVIAKATLSDDGSVFTKAKLETGP